MKLFGLEIANKTDILAFTAFLLSVISILHQAYNFLRGPEVTLANLRQVVLYFIRTPDADERHLTFISSFAYVNSGAVENNAVVMEERIGFSMNQKNYIFTWHGFVQMNSQPALIGLNGPDKRTLQIEEIKTAGPFVIRGSGAEAHETRFAARLNDDFVDEKEVVNHFKDALKGSEVKWPISFYAETLNDCRISLHAKGFKDCRKSATCEITMTWRFMQQLLKRGWTIINCNRV